MSENRAKQKAVLSAEVPEPDTVNVTVDGAKKYYIQALACLCLTVSKKLETPLPRLLGEIGVQGSLAHVNPKRWVKDSSGLIICPECGEEHSWIDYRASYCDTCGTRLLPEEGNEDYA